MAAGFGEDIHAHLRWRFAVLKLSRGDLERLKREIDGAHLEPAALFVLLFGGLVALVFHYCRLRRERSLVETV